jgi:hypothetical protein
MTSPSTQQRPKTGLTKPGVVVLQSLFIGLVSVIEVEFRHGIGVFTGVMICIAVLGTIRFGRRGTEYVSAATAPLAFAIVTLITTAFVDGFHVSKVGVDFLASLASAAPYLLIAAAYGWFSYFRSRRSRPTK